MSSRESVGSLVDSHRANSSHPDRRILIPQNRRLPSPEQFFRRCPQLRGSIPNSPPAAPISGGKISNVGGEFSSLGGDLSSVGGTSPMAEFSPPAVELSNPVAEFAPPAIEFSPPTAGFSPPAVEFAPTATEFSPPTVELCPPAAELSPPSVGVAPPTVPFSPLSFENRHFHPKTTLFGTPSRRETPFWHFSHPLA